MQYRWLDYVSDYAPLIDSWLDDDARRYTGCDDGWEDYFNYWKNDSQTQMGVNFWEKVIFCNDVPLAVVSIGFSENRFTVSEFIVAPDYRNQGHGSVILRELLENGRMILGREVESAFAVIFPNNIPSQKAFQKAVFQFESAHPDGDAWYYTYYT